MAKLRWWSNASNQVHEPRDERYFVLQFDFKAEASDYMDNVDDVFEIKIEIKFV